MNKKDRFIQKFTSKPLLCSGVQGNENHKMTAINAISNFESVTIPALIYCPRFKLIFESFCNFSTS